MDKFNRKDVSPQGWLPLESIFIDCLNTISSFVKISEKKYPNDKKKHKQLSDLRSDLLSFLNYTRLLINELDQRNKYLEYKNDILWQENIFLDSISDKTIENAKSPEQLRKLLEVIRNNKPLGGI